MESFYLRAGFWCPVSQHETRRTPECSAFWSHILKAVSTGDLSLLQALLKETVISDRNSSIDTLLHIAADHGQVAVINFLAGADIHAKDQASKTPQHLAAQNGHRNTVKSLIAEEYVISCEPS
uniref:Uncharacterized protein n=1 Tax=Astyanax mexicanus TaxID=7994 RepID=A0A8B9K7J6_ASTMX